MSEISAIGPYVILSKIASGGMGDVYLARRKDGNTQVALAAKRVFRVVSSKMANLYLATKTPPAKTRAGRPPTARAITI